MNVTNAHEAKTNFSKLLERAANGERIIVGKAGKSIARLEPFSNTKAVYRQFKGDGTSFTRAGRTSTNRRVFERTCLQ